MFERAMDLPRTMILPTAPASFMTLTATPVQAQSSKPAPSCDALAEVEPPNATITMARSYVDQRLVSGMAPDERLSSKVSAKKTIRTRPLCAYPGGARYKGARSMDEAESFNVSNSRRRSGRESLASSHHHDGRHEPDPE